MSTSEDWTRIRALFERALALPLAERASFVHTESGSESLAAEVLAMLEAHAIPGGLDRVASALERLSEPPPPEADTHPTHIGPYRVVRPLGQGGMGRVYLAERADGQFEHQVALKVMRGGAVANALRPRFLAERQILAQLVHPNIAWLLDGNVTEEGLPYFVMEYVEGRPLVEHCDARELDLRGRLNLFLEVCDAVSYAHQRLVVHRDLKPSNVLVAEADGRVKLLDFGIAKLMGDQPGSETLTRAGGAPLTPEYAAPEQLSGGPITLAADVYQLGALLYELLTGRRPYQSSASDSGLDLSASFTREPRRPSQAVTGDPASDPAQIRRLARSRGSSPKRLTRDLAGDLDHIILKALRREPEQRFRSVDDLADDVRRYLTGRPVHARRGTYRYRASRFVRRNRLAVAAGAVAIAALVVGTITTAYQARRASEQAATAALARDRAELETLHAQEVTDFLIGLFDEASDQGVRADTLRLLPVLERGVAALDDSVSMAPASRSRVLASMAKLFDQMGQLDQAEQLARDALALAETVGDEDPTVVPEAQVRLGAVLWERGNVAQSNEQASAALIAYESLLAARPNDPELRDEVAQTRVSVATTLWSLQKLDAADSMALLSIDEFRALDDEEALANVLNLRGAIAQNTTTPERSIGLYQEALEIWRRLYPEGHMLIGVGMNNVASAMLYDGRVEEAADLQRQVLDHRIRQFGEDHPMVAAVIHNLAASDAELGRFEESIAGYEKALAMRRRLLGPQNRDVGITLSAFGLMLLEKLDRCTDALPLLHEAVPVWVETMGPKHGFVFKTQANIGHCYARLGEFARAERELLAAHAGLMEIVGSEHGETVRAGRYLEDLYERWERPEDAAVWRERDPKDPSAR